MKRIVRLTESDLTKLVKRVIMEQEQGYTIEEFSPKIQNFLKRTGLDASSFIKPVPPATSINFKKRTGGYIGLGHLEYFERTVDQYNNGIGVVQLVNNMIQNK